MKFIGTLLVGLGISLAVSAQEKESENAYDENFEFPEKQEVQANIGIGLGMDYGGIGAKISILPNPKISLSGGVGYNFNGAGWNLGMAYRFTHDKKVNPYLSAMYGYNGVIVVVGREEVNKTYYGPSFGFGLEFVNHRENHWNVALWLPVHSQDYKDDLEKLENDPSIEMGSPLPFAFSVGYHFKF